MNLGRFFQRLALYRASRGVPLWVLVALALGFWALAAFDAKASAHPDQVSAHAHCTEQQGTLANYCETAYPDVGGAGPATTSYNQCDLTGYDSQTDSWTNRVSCQRPDGSLINDKEPFGYHTFPKSDSCVAPLVFDPATGTCVDPDEQCAARNTQPGFFNVGVVSKPFSSKCLDGCTYAANCSSQGCTTTSPAGGIAITSAEFEWGGTCSTNSEPPRVDEFSAEKNQECQTLPGQADATVKMCVKNDGQQCITSTAGRQLCWTPGQTGEKTDADHKHRRNPGTDTTPPTPTTNDTLTPTIPPTTVTTTINNTTIVTTTTGGKTTTGVDAGSTNDGEAGDGSQGAPGDSSSPAMEQLGDEAAGLDTGEGGEGVDGTTAWGADEGGDFVADEGGFGLARACPIPPQIQGISMDWAGLCEVMGYVGLLVLAAAHMHALYIIAGD